MAYLSLPILIFMLFIVGFLDLRYILRFAFEGALTDLTMAILLTLITVAVVYGLRILIRWLRSD